MNISRWILRNKTKNPHDSAIQLGNHHVFSHAQLAERVMRRASWLVGQGLMPGERVVVFMGNSPAYVEYFFAILWAGGVIVPVNAKLHASELAIILQDAAPIAVLVDQRHQQTGADAVKQNTQPVPLFVIEDPLVEEAAARLDEMPMAERKADDLAWLFFTSGTTGKPKGAMLTHRNLTMMAESYLAEVDNVRSSDGILHAAPMSHGSGMYMIPYVMRGARQIIPESGGFDEAEIAYICGTQQGVAFFAAPTMVHRMLKFFSKPERQGDAKALLSGLKLIVYGGGSMLLDTAKRARTFFGPRLAQIYGQGECPMTISRLQMNAFLLPDDERSDRMLTSVGQPFSSVEVRIDGSNEPHQVGEILVKSGLLMAGYWKSPEATASAIIDGWLYTGDIGYFDDDGNLHLTDRAKDVIISGGTNIYSREVEDILIQHPMVDEVAVIGKPSEEWGEEVAAFIVAKAGETIARELLDTHCLLGLARFKRPKYYYFVLDIPKSAYGKIDKKTLREWL